MLLFFVFDLEWQSREALLQSISLRLCEHDSKVNFRFHTVHESIVE